MKKHWKWASSCGVLLIILFIGVYFSNISFYLDPKKESESRVSLPEARSTVKEGDWFVTAEAWKGEKNLIPAPERLKIQKFLYDAIIEALDDRGNITRYTVFELTQSELTWRAFKKLGGTKWLENIILPEEDQLPFVKIGVLSGYIGDLWTGKERASEEVLKEWIRED